MVFAKIRQLSMIYTTMNTNIGTLVNLENKSIIGVPD
jgi:hypothetical protein